MPPYLLLRSASFRLAAAYVLLFVASVLVLGTIAYWRTTSEFEREAHVRIEAEGSSLSREFAEGGVDQVVAAVEKRRRSKLAGGLDYFVYDNRGAFLLGHMENPPFSAGWTTIPAPPDGDEPPGEKERLTVLAIPLSDTLWLAIGDDLIRIEAFGNALLSSFAWVALLSVTLAVVGGIVLSTLVLGRVSAITSTAEAIISGDIHRRVPRRRANDELDRLAATLNRMLDRITALMDALRHVSSSIAHELRTPLAHLKQMLEGAREKVPDKGASASIDEAIEEVDSILATFSALLRIAQIESGTRRQGFKPVDLSAIVESIAQTFTPIAQDGGHLLAVKVEPGAIVNGDTELLTQLVVNLLENALRHTPSGTPISMTLAAGARPELIVADRGSGIPEHARRAVFERFSRLDSASGVSGSGLGLSIVRAIADLHDIVVELGNNKPGLVVRVAFASTGAQSATAPQG
jgi:signal transduction histidine kinase